MPTVPTASPDARRLRAALRSYAAGDAFGVGYEFLDHPVDVDVTRLRRRADDEDWPVGAVSDDTVLTLWSIAALQGNDPVAARAEFLHTLSANVDRVRGLGPTTRAALGLEVSAADAPLVGRTNGALMRTALVGLAYRPRAAHARRSMVRQLASATHGHPRAIEAAQLGAALACALFERPEADVAELIESEWTQLVDADPDTLSTVLEWQPSEGGVSLDPLDTLGAVVHVTGGAPSVADAYRAACELGGDTDTVAALAGAFVSMRDDDARGPDDLPWAAEVGWDEIADLDACVDILASLRGES